MLVEQITERTYANLTGASRCNLGAISMPNYAVIIDTGMYPPITQEFRLYIEKVTGTPVKKAILTHGHSDHVFGNQIFKDCDIIANHAINAQMRESAPIEWTREALDETAKLKPDSYDPLDLDILEIIFPTEVVADSFTLTDDGYDIVYKQIGGHSADSSYIYFPAEKVIFVGDLLFSHEFPWGGSPTSNLDTWIQTFKEFQQLNVHKIVPGHGTVCGLDKVQVYLDFFESVAKIMKEQINEGRTQKEIVEYDGYPDFFPPRTPEWRRDSLTQWYQVYKSNLTKY